MLKTSDCTVALQIDGGEPVNPTSGNAGTPVLNERDGITTSLLSARMARDFATFAWAIFTSLLHTDGKIS
jgi:hypothetical protein